jgi:hypothetical protein
MDASTSKKRILILGGGFGGIYTARHLEGQPASSNGSAAHQENGHAPNAKAARSKRSAGEFDLHNRIAEVLQDCLGSKPDGLKPELCGAGKQK